jgi:hypothetical protein
VTGLCVRLVRSSPHLVFLTKTVFLESTYRHGFCELACHPDEAREITMPSYEC